MTGRKVGKMRVIHSVSRTWTPEHQSTRATVHSRLVSTQPFKHVLYTYTTVNTHTCTHPHSHSGGGVTVWREELLQGHRGEIRERFQDAKKTLDLGDGVGAARQALLWILLTVEHLPESMVVQDVNVCWAEGKEKAGKSVFFCPTGLPVMTV